MSSFDEIYKDPIRVKALLKEVEKLRTDKRYLIFAIGVGVLLAIIRPGYTLLSNDSYQSKLEDARTKAVEDEWATFYGEDGWSFSAMTCIANELYFEGTATPAMERWLREDFDLEALENDCHRSPDPEPIFPEP